MLGIIIQARLGSTRFPRKIIQPFSNGTVLSYLLNRLSRLNLPIIVATTTSEIDDELCDYLSNLGVLFYRGSETNVLDRYVCAADNYGFTDIVRVCSDNPFIDIGSIKKLEKIYITERFDYLSWSYKGKPVILCHFGVFAELVSLKSLKYLLYNFNTNKYFCEHVTYGIYTNPGLFSVSFEELSKEYDDCDDLRMTLDTKEDYENLVYVQKKYMLKQEIDFLTLCRYLKNEDSLIKKMQLNIDLNKK